MLRKHHHLKLMMLFSLCVLLMVIPSLSLSPIEIKGYKFFDSQSSEEFVVRGVDYFPRPNTGDLNFNSMDLYTKKHRKIWERDIVYLQELGVNAIRLYAVDPAENHDDFMCAMEAAGIYVIVALAHDCPTCAITRDASPLCYPRELKTQGQAIINSFANYPNTLAFSAGNEVNHFAPLNQPEWNAPCQKKFLRDMREYVASCDSLRNVPIGLVSADDQRDALAHYYNCHSDPTDTYESAEWYGLNAYVFCDGKAESYHDALGLQLLAKSFADLDYSIPVLLTEFGCLSETFEAKDEVEAQRNFKQARWMLTESDMREQFSGGFAFEYSIEDENAKSESQFPFKKFGHQNFGLGYFAAKDESEDCDDIHIRCDYHPLPSFDMLREAYTNANTTGLVQKDTFLPSPNRAGRSKCPYGYPTLASMEWEADLHENLECPSPLQAQKETCSAPLYDELFSMPTAVLFVLTVVVGVAGRIFFRRKPSYSLLAESKYAIPESESSQSDESTGLMSMKVWSTSDAEYQAIESDSSTD